MHDLMDAAGAARLTKEVGVPGALDRPILVVGAARSGTWMLASILGLHPEVAFLAEPNYIWKYSNAWLGHDMIPASRATPAVRAYIRSKFAQYCRDRGKTRLCEKTPANTMRLPFVLEVLPDAKVIHIIRDGRDVVASATKKYHGDVVKMSRLAALDSTAAKRDVPALQRLRATVRRARGRFKDGGVPARDLLFYTPFFVNSALNMLGLRKRYIWGPHIPGLKQLFRSHSIAEVAAIQWRMSVEGVLNFVESRPDIDCMQIRFEDLCAEPSSVVKRIFEFCELEYSAQIEDGVLEKSAISRTLSSARLGMTAEEERRVNDHIAHTLRMLGYTGRRSMAANRESGPACGAELKA